MQSVRFSEEQIVGVLKPHEPERQIEEMRRDPGICRTALCG
jgi:hypothetical protein